MNCPNDNILRASLDGELDSSKAIDDVSRHLESCASCRNRLEALKLRAQHVQNALGTLDAQSEQPSPDASMAYKRFCNQLQSEGDLKLSWWNRLFAPGWRSAWGLGALA